MPEDEALSEKDDQENINKNQQQTIYDKKQVEESTEQM